jgi:hypothetical protein
VSEHYDSPASIRLNHGRGFVQTHRPAFWAAVVLLAVGIVLGGFGLLTALETISFINALLFGCVFAFAALAIWVILQISDLDPKPASMVAAAFAGGALVPSSIVQTMSGSLGHVFSKVVSDAAWGHGTDGGDRRGVLRRLSWCW